MTAAPIQIDPAPRELISSIAIVGAIDLDSNGQTELIGLSSDRILRSYQTNATGQLIKAQDLAPAADPAATIEAIPQTAADVDGDGLLDLVGTRSSSFFAVDEVMVWFGRGGGRFEAPIAIATFDSVGAPYHVLLNDFDGDGDLDVILHPRGSWHPLYTFAPQVQVQAAQQVSRRGRRRTL